MKFLMVTREEAPVLMITKNLLLITFLLIRLTRQPWQGKHPSQVKIWWLLRVRWGWSEVVGMLRWGEGIVKVPQILIFAVCQYNGYFYIVKYYCLPSLYNSEDNVSLVWSASTIKASHVSVIWTSFEYFWQSSLSPAVAFTAYLRSQYSVFISPHPHVCFSQVQGDSEGKYF